MEPAAQFASLVSGHPSAFELDRACSLMSAAFTGVDRHEVVVSRLAELAAQVAEPTLDGVLSAMRHHLTGNRHDYYDARNSFIDEVLTRGVGLPITLSVVAIEIGRRADVPVVGIGLPGHFMVREAQRDVYGDPFHDGAAYNRAGVVSAWSRLVGDSQSFDEMHLAPVSERVIVIRMLNNLRAVYAQRNDTRAMYALSVMRGSFVELAHEAPQHARWVRHFN